MPHESLTPPMPDARDAPARGVLEAALCELLTEVSGSLVLAVSGGGDSMALLHAAARSVPDRVATVATFDHGTGAAAREAAALVVRTAGELGLSVECGRAPVVARTESAWRTMRWAFLDDVARRHGARVATAHTADDQLETIVQRVLRGTGTRGLAALAAPSLIVRPWLYLSRATVRAYVTQHEIPTVTDPANSDPRHQRVRVRAELLPAFEQAVPGFGASMLALGERAAEWRRDVDAMVAALPWQQVAPGVWRFARIALAAWRPDALAVLWPALLADVSVVLSGEGTDRLVRFTTGDARAGELQLSGGVTVVRQRDWFEVRAAAVTEELRRARRAEPQRVRVGAPLTWPGWSITPHECPSPSPASEVDEELDAAWAAFPEAEVLQVRCWQPGDRIRTAGARAGRRIARYLSEAGVPRCDRHGWPVVLFEGLVVWVPGVVRGLAAPHRSGRSDLIWYRSDRDCS